ncbi:YwmB family TATA-box binding protein [Paenibacillus puldeungensis]|uniref:YwmB family TATA-box binding protein n=1 Tax=Paenibacillus puldeungensis TaxID=696536 RepID=A0ABW3S0C9_9BACL
MRIWKLWSSGLILIVCFIILLGMTNKGNEQEIHTDPVQLAHEQLQKVISIAEKAIQGPYQTTIKWQGEWNTLLSPVEAAGVLSSRLGLPAPVKTMIQDHEVYSTKGQFEGMVSELSVTGRGAGVYYVVLRLEANSSKPVNDIATAQDLAGSSLIDEGVTAAWNVALQGIKAFGQGGAQSVGATNSEALSADLLALEQELKGEIALKRVEGFSDENTVSQTYVTAGLPIAIASGNHQVALQMAIHRSSDTGQSEISIGSPLLTVEY